MDVQFLTHEGMDQIVGNLTDQESSDSPDVEEMETCRYGDVPNH